MEQPAALITGASQGLGRAIAEALAGRGWRLVVDARRRDRLDVAVAAMSDSPEVIAIEGDVADPDHRAELVAAVNRLGRLDLLVNNASTLGASPLPSLDTIDLDLLRRVYEVNVFAPLALTQPLLAMLAESGGTVVNVTSDAGVEAYETWGGYGSSKAALEQLSAILGAEQPKVRVLVVDPGDMRTEMHQDAFPGEDISDRPLPETVVPHLLALDRQRSTERSIPAVGGDVMTATLESSLSLPLDPSLEAHEPAEVRGRGRDDVKLLVSDGADRVVHTTFRDLPDPPSSGRPRRREHVGDRRRGRRRPSARRTRRAHPLLDRAPGRAVARRGTTAGRRHHGRPRRRPHG